MIKMCIHTRFAIAFVISSLILSECGRYGKVREDLDFIFPKYVKCDVIEVTSSNTFYCQLSNRETEKIKLIGIEIPESIEEKAEAFTRSILRRGDPVKLEFDKEVRDSYGLILAYVYLPSGKMVNTLLIHEGYARIEINPPNVRYRDLFLNLDKSNR